MSKSPQEKKILSYQKDRRNRFGQNDKASRKAIPRAKARGNRRYRAKIKRALRAGEIDEAEATRLERFDKTPDQPLAVEIGGRWWHRGAPDAEPSELQAEALRRLRRGDSGHFD